MGIRVDRILCKQKWESISTVIMENKQVEQYLNKALSILSDTHIVLPKVATINVYHHVGREHIEETGALFMNVVNNDYCKSYVVMTEGQKYPEHFHKIKNETFYVLHGTLVVVLDGEEHILQAGEMLDISRGQDHSFWGLGDVVFEEISTTYLPNDSLYLDESINQKSYLDRRTVVRPEEWKEIRNRWIK